MLKVLIVEDSLIIADILEEYLILEGYEVCGLARTVEEAVQLADLHKPDLAVLDFRLGDGKYGSQIRPLLKDKTSMGILYVSGDPLRDKLTKADGDAFIQKPYGLKDLSKSLNIIQGLKSRSSQPEETYPRGFHLLSYSPAVKSARA